MAVIINVSDGSTVEELHGAMRAIEFLLSLKSPFVSEVNAAPLARVYSLTAVADVPNVPSAPAVPSIAVAPVPPTVPEVPTATSINLATVFAQNGPAILPSEPPSVPPTPSGSPTAITPTTDKTGLPWDARIHAGTKSLNADGSWKKKRGSLPEFVDSVERELRGVQALPSPGAPPPPGTPALDFEAITFRMVNMSAAGKFTNADVSKVLAEYGIESWGLLKARPDILAAVCAKLGV